MSREADAVLVADRVETMRPGSPPPTAVALRDGRVLAVGGEELVEELPGRRTRVERFPGATITPGLIDAHSHPLLGARRARGVDLGAVQDLDHLVRAVGAEAATAGPEEWVLGWNLGYDLFAGSPVEAAPLEPVLDGRPMLLLFFDGHTALASRRALEVTDRTPTGADSASFVLDGRGRPTGEVREESAIAAVLAATPALDEAEVAERSLRVLGAMAAVGCTGACLMDGDARAFALLDRMESAGDLPLRLTAALQHDPEFDDDRVREHLELRDRGGRRWRGGLIKLYADGVIDTGTGWLAEPDTRHEGTAGLWADPGAYRDTVLRYASAGFQIATHAIGDAAIGAALDAYEAAGAPAGGRPAHRVEHLELLADRDVERLRRLGVTASMQPSHMQWRRSDDTDSWGARVGPERTGRAWRTGDLVRAGVRLALGSDWPVAGFDPREVMAWARLRRAPGRRDDPVLEPEQALSAREALAGCTVWATTAEGDAGRGVIEPGAAADLAVWAEDPLRVDGDDLPAVPILATFLDGSATHRAGG